MTKKKRELIEILLDNVKPEDWPEGAVYAAQDKETLTWGKQVLMFYSDFEIPHVNVGRGSFAGEKFGREIKLPELCKHWNKTIVHRDEFMRRWNERNTKAEAKTPQQLAIEKFGTDWHDNEGVRPFSDTSIKIDLEFKNATIRENVSVDSSLFMIPFCTPEFTVTKWRIHSDEKESHIDIAAKSLSDGMKALSDVMPTAQQAFDGFKKAAESMSSTDIKSIIADRGNNYGRFEDGAEIMQQLKLIAHTSQGWERMKPIQREGMDMILHKIGRILNGDPAYVDSWVDIEGYSRLVSDWLKGESK